VATTTGEAYRVIKRTHSFIQDHKSQDTLVLQNKRQKTKGEDSIHAPHHLFASRTASLRRADSLKSVQAAGDGKACMRTFSL
jgi:hypothetical protein